MRLQRGTFGIYSLVEYAKNHTQMKEKETALDEVTEQFGKLAAEVARQDSLISTLGEEIIETEHKLNHTDNSLVSVRSKIEQRLQRIDFLRTRISELQEREKSAREKIEKLREQKNLFEKNSAQYDAELANCEKMLDEKGQAVEQIQKAIQQV